MNPSKKRLTVREVAQREGWTIAKVQRLCASGRLPAINTSPGPLPRYEIYQEDLDRFVTPKQPQTADAC